MLTTLVGHSLVVWRVAFNPNSSKMVTSGSLDNTVRL
ncbi:WD40 repeat domain-containing protein [Nostoc sp.]